MTTILDVKCQETQQHIKVRFEYLFLVSPFHDEMMNYKYLEFDGLNPLKKQFQYEYLKAYPSSLMVAQKKKIGQV